MELDDAIASDFSSDAESELIDEDLDLYTFVITPEFDPDQLDFVNYLDFHRKKMVNDNYMRYLDSQLTSNEPLCEAIYHWDYKLHLPRDAVKMLTHYIIKIDSLDSCNLNLLDTHLRIYLHTMILYFMKHPSRSPDENVNAAILYGKLILSPIGSDFFSLSMFRHAIFIVFKHFEAVPNGCMTILSLIGNYNITYSKTSEMPGYIKIVMNCLNSCNKEIIKNFKTDATTAGQLYKLIYYILISTLNHEIIFHFLLKCFYKPEDFEDANHQLIGIQNTSCFIRLIYKSLPQDELKNLYNALTIILTEVKFIGFDQIVQIMSLFPEEKYIEIVQRIVDRLVSYKNVNDDITRSLTYWLGAAIKARLFILNNQVNYMYKFMLKNIVLNTSQANTAPLFVLNELIHLEKNIAYNFDIHTLFCNGPVSRRYDTLLAIIMSLYDKNEPISTSELNSVLFRLLLAFMTASPITDGEADLIGMFCHNQDANNLRPFMKDLYKTLIFKRRDNLEREVPAKICNIFYKCSVDNTVHSVDFLKFIYKILSSAVSSSPFESYVFTDLLPRNELDEIFEQFGKHNLYTFYDLEAQFNKLEKCNLEFTAAIVNYFSKRDDIIFHDVTKVTTYLIRNQHLQLTDGNVNYYILLHKLIFGKDNSDFLPEELAELQIIYDSLMDKFTKFIIPINSFQKMYGLLSGLASVLNVDEGVDFSLLEEVYDDVAILNMCSYTSDTLPYRSELMLATNNLPSQSLIDIISTTLLIESKKVDSQIRDSKFWYDAVALFANIAILNNEYATLAVDCLKFLVQSNDKVKVLTGLKMIHAISKESTHNYKYLIDTTFSILKNDSHLLLEYCMNILQDVISDEYLKMTVEQFLIFVHLLGVPEQSDQMEELLNNYFLTNQQHYIVKHFIHLIILFNRFDKSTKYTLKEVNPLVLDLIITRVTNHRQIYKVLFRSLNFNLRIKVSDELTTVMNEFITTESCMKDSKWRITVLDCLFVLKLNNEKFNEQEISKQIIMDTMTIVDEEYLGTPKKMLKSIPLFTGDCAELEMILNLVASVLNYLANSTLRNKCNIAYELFECCIYIIDIFNYQIKMHIRAENPEDFLLKFRKLLGFYEEYGVNYYKIVIETPRL